MFPGSPSFDPSSFYIPEPAGVYEHNLGDEWRGIWMDTEEVPEGILLSGCYLFLFMDGKGYVTRSSEDVTWGTPTGVPAEGESFQQLVARMAKEQAGITLKKTIVHGMLGCKATSHNAKYPAGSISLQPFVIGIASKVDDIAASSGSMRRRLPANEYIAAMRKRYPEWERYVGDLVSRYLILEAKGEG